MSFLFDPNVAFLLLMASIILGVLALLTPGTGFLEIGALFAVVLTGYAIYHLVFNWWALVLVLVSIVPFFFAVRKPKQAIWLIPTLVFLAVGSVFLFQRTPGQEPINPFVAILSSAGVILVLWLIGRKTIDAMRMRPTQDLGRLEGQVGEARSDIKTKGTVYVGGEEWSARSEKLIRSGESVKVVGREGLVLIVAPEQERK